MVRTPNVARTIIARRLIKLKLIRPNDANKTIVAIALKMILANVPLLDTLSSRRMIANTIVANTAKHTRGTTETRKPQVAQTSNSSEQGTIAIKARTVISIARKRVVHKARTAIIDSIEKEFFSCFKIAPFRPKVQRNPRTLGARCFLFGCLQSIAAGTRPARMLRWRARAHADLAARPPPQASVCELR